MDTKFNLSHGWCPDVPDTRDFESSQFRDCQKLLPHVDLREEGLDLSCSSFSPSCSCAPVVLSLLDWSTRKWQGTSITASALFLHQMTLKLWGGGGAHGVSLRSTIKTLKRLGCPPERLYPSDTEWTNNNPSSPELFAFSKPYSDLSYFRIDTWRTPRSSLVTTIRNFLSTSTPCLLGFPVPSCLSNDASATIPLDTSRGGTEGGTACIALGYNDHHIVSPFIRCQTNDSQHQTQGAFLIKTCWGEHWGEHGYGWLPYAYIESNLARDIWFLAHPEWT